jgi:hypothetical protein
LKIIILNRMKKVNFFPTGSLSELIKRRLTPAILFFDMEENLLYSNTEALDIMQGLRGTTVNGAAAIPYIPNGIYKSLKENS